MREIKLFQQKLTQMLGWFDTFCRSNNLTYYALGGTMLGAVRHKGFIPWDDDVDVGLPRADYDRFFELTHGQVFENKYIAESLQSGSDYLLPYMKVFDLTTTLVENTRSKLKRGIFLDIFPLDGLGDSKEQSIEQYKKILRRLNLFSARSCAVRKGRSALKNLAVIALKPVPEFVVSQKRLAYKIDKLCRKLPFEDCAYGGSLLGGWGLRECMPTKYFGTPTDYDFEGLKICGVADYDSYLTALYGDYMQLPPKHKRITHHDFIQCDLYKPYK